MDVQLLALLRVQRELLREPRGFGRFQSYLKTMIGGDGELGLPLAAFNPMSKEHVGKVLDTLLAMDAERIAEDALQESVARLSCVEALRGMPVYRFGLVIAAEARGGGVNPYFLRGKDRFKHV